MAAAAMPTLPSFDAHGEPSTTALRWERWLQRFEGAMVGFGITNNTRKRALLLFYAGEEVENIFNTLENTGNANDYDTAKTKLTEHFTPKKNPDYETILFRRTFQNAGEDIDTYVTRLRKIAVNCEFTDVDRELRIQVLDGCYSKILRKRALEKTRTLEEVLDLARALELSNARAATINNRGQTSSQDNSVNKIGGQGRGRGRRNTRTGQSMYASAGKNSYQLNTNSTPNKTCIYCGGDYPHTKGPCPAKGKNCNYCNTPNHFARVCFKRDQRSRNTSGNLRSVAKPGQEQQVKTVSQPNPSRELDFDPVNNDSYQYTTDETTGQAFEVTGVSTPTNSESMHRVNSVDDNMRTVLIENTPVKVCCDSGCKQNIINESTYQKINQMKNTPLMHTNIKLFPYCSDTPLPIIGKIHAQIETPELVTEGIVFVVRGSKANNLLGLHTGRELKLLQVNTITEHADIIQQFPEVTKGIGKLKDVLVKVHIDETVPPVAQTNRRTPFHLREKIEDKLKELQDNDIIEDATGPTPWVSPIVATPKPKNPDDIRLCIDMRQANEAIKREHHDTPTVDQLIAELTDSKVFSKLDLKSGYHQLEIHPDSRYITTFATSLGLKRYKRLNFGICSASEIFQNTIRQAIAGIPGVINISDDILVHAPTQEEHDKRLKALLERLREKGLTVSLEKCEFNKNKLDFLGFTFSDKGLSPDPAKVADLRNAKPPANASEVQSLLGMIQFSSRFIPNLSSIEKPLREVTRQDKPFTWQEPQQKAFQRLKESLSEDRVMAYFDINKQTELWVDASPIGLGAILSQVDKHGTRRNVCYASKALTDTEQRYSQIEREALAVTWAIERFHLFVYGCHFKVITDHKPLVPIFAKPQANPNRRIRNWLLKLQSYDKTIEYRPGKYNPADYLSRHPPMTTTDNVTTESEEQINFIVDYAKPNSLSREEISHATVKDATLKKVIQCYHNNRWHELKTLHRSFWSIRDELTVTSDNIILRNDNIVIPDTLQDRVIALAHVGHQGISKTKALLRTKVWFPGLDRKTEHAIRGCIPCQATIPHHQREPLIMSALPDYAWQKVSVDFAGPFPSGHYLLVVYDDYSRFTEVEITTSTSARATIPKLDKLFATHGIPETVKTDNGPPWNSYEFNDFANYLGFHHQKVTPLWPEANGMVERFMRTLKKTIQTAQVEGKVWQQELWSFLRNYRATPHSTTGVSPAEALYGHQIRTSLPQIHIPSTANNQNRSKILERDRKAKQNMKQYADTQRHTTTSKIREGDLVLVQNQKRNKLTPYYDPNPYTVISKKGSLVTAQRSGHQITRNVSFFKKVQKQPNTPQQNWDDNEDSYVDQNIPIQRQRPQRNRRPPAYLNDFIT